MTNTILVTGGAGFIGGNFVHSWLVQSRGPVVNLDTLTYSGKLHTLATVADRPDYSFVHGDICDSDLLDQLLVDHQPRAILHFAAETHVDRSIAGPEAFLKTNVNGTLRLLQAAKRYASSLPEVGRQAFRFVHVSTDEVYGTLLPNCPRSSRTALTTTALFNFRRS